MGWLLRSFSIGSLPECWLEAVWGGLPLAGQTWQSLGISPAKDSRFNHDPTIYQPSWRIEQTVSYGMC